MMTKQASGSFLKKRTKKLLFLLAVAGLTAIAAVHNSRAASKLDYEPATAQISGILGTEMHYGPPNYGEEPATDMKVWPFILTLDSPVDVIATSHSGLDQDSFFAVRRMQITALPSLSLRPYLGKHVSLSGHLFERENGNHYTNVLIFVQDIKTISGSAL